MSGIFHNQKFLKILAAETPFFLGSVAREPECVTCAHMQGDVLHDHVWQGDDGADGREAVPGRGPAEKGTSVTCHVQSQSIATGTWTCTGWLRFIPDVQKSS